MTKLSQELNQCLNSNPDLNGVIENNLIYVTSVPDIQSATLERVKKNNLRDCVQHEDSYISTNGHCNTVPAEPEVNDQELELKQEIIDESPLTPDQKVETARTISETAAVLPRSPEGGRVKRTIPEEQISAAPAAQPTTKAMMEVHKVRHREMAVDVPDSFIAVTKTPPRYPPPRPAGTNGGSLNGRTGVHEYVANEGVKAPLKEVNRRSNSSWGSDLPPARDAEVRRDYRKGISNGPEGTPPTPRISELRRNQGNTSGGHKVRVNGKGPPVPPKPVLGNVNGVSSDVNKEEQLERIRKYQEDIRKRKEEEERLAKEEEFLRSSLRGSKKLQALENKSTVPRTGIINTAFHFEEGDSETLPIGHKAGCLVGEIEDIPGQAKVVGVPELLKSLHSLAVHLQNNGLKNEDLKTVEHLIRTAEFQKMLNLHNVVQKVCCFDCPAAPVCTNAEEIANEVRNLLQNYSSHEVDELSDILNKYNFEGLMYSHDKIAERYILPTILADDLLERVSQYTEESVKIVRIDKTSEPLGATVKNEGEAVIIGRIVKGGAAEKSGLLHEGDEVLEVNSIELRGKSVNDVCDILMNMTGTLTFLIVPSQYESPKTLPRETVMHVKAHFDYDAEDDLYIPCRELGISFQKGDILHVISQEDTNWWQAYRDGDEDQTLAGLIPSKSFQQQREAMKQTIVADTNNRERSRKGKFLCAKKHHKKKKKRVMYNPACNDEFDAEQVLTYEEVALYYPRSNRKRPIVLIGPSSIGRHELRQRLMEDTERFAAAVPHTSRPRKTDEVDGMDYHFITRPQFVADIQAGKFVEHGEYEKNYYGTSLDAIRAVVLAGKTCVLNLHPLSLKILKNSDLKPFVVFIAPPSFEKLRQNRIKQDLSVKDEELREIIENAREMEENYGHYFDMVVVNTDMNITYNDLLREMSVIEREPQWVPATWLRNETN